MHDLINTLYCGAYLIELVIILSSTSISETILSMANIPRVPVFILGVTD